MNWISVKERKPEQRKIVLAYGRLTSLPDYDHKNDPYMPGQIGIYMCLYRQDKSSNRSWDAETPINDCGSENRSPAYVINVTHWMELPKEPVLESK